MSGQGMADASMAEHSSTIGEDQLKCLTLEFGPSPIFENPYLY